MARFKFLLMVLASVVVSDEGAKILAVFPTPSISHQVVFRPLTMELVKRGHEVVVITTDPVFKDGGAPANLTELDVHDISYDIWRKGILESNTISGNKKDLDNQMNMMMTLMLSIFEQQMQVDKVRNILNKSQHFDLLLLEAFFSPLLGLSHVFKAPVIQISSFGPTEDNLKAVGAVSHPILYPTCVHQRVKNLTLWEKIKQFYNQYQTDKMFSQYDELCHLALQRMFGTEVPKMNELKNNVDMLFVNIHSVWENNRPVPPNVIFMGGLHQKPEKELPQDLKTYLDSSKHGVIYISFGTNVEPALLPPEKLQAIINSVSKLPYDVLWKWNHDELPGRTPNINISKWLPQSDLLRHPKIKLFITQGGLQSTDEAITAGVPLIGMPMLGDQWYNVEQYVYHKIGIKVDMDTITEDEVTNAIETIIRDNSYRENVARLRQLMLDQPQSPLERAVWWTEYVIRHSGARHLRAPAANMPWHQYLELELVTYFVLGLLSVILGTVILVSYLYRNIFKEYFNIKFKSD
ncbi:hypothetical protein ABMA28_010117 [Loxostege sticticalis]|uniref:UDP-glucuronosyltransferase n=1 Tax=Loxostege sticticalis TaxID=481309 RepID=A0ABD0SAR7_LOXSC